MTRNEGLLGWMESGWAFSVMDNVSIEERAPIEGSLSTVRLFFSLMVAKLGLCPLPGEFGARAL